MHPAIRVENLSKCFRIGATPTGSLNVSESVRAAARSTWRKLKRLATPDSVETDEGFWALDDVSFEVHPGEVVGVVGRNGAGKSTLLKLLSRITAPTRGRVEVRGRMGSLLEVGTGFHPELTGRENVFLNGSVLGMSRSEIRRKFDDIVAFADIGPFLDTPVKRYSSGMYVKLAFSVAAHLDPEILIVDEVLAVGDAAFQRRCVERMTDLAARGRTILFVSHNMELIPRLCQRAVFLERGKVVEVGPATAVTQRYLEKLVDANTAGDLRDRKRTTGTGEARFTRAVLLDADGQPTATHTFGDDLRIRVELEAPSPVRNATLWVCAQALGGSRIASAWTPEADFPVTLPAGKSAFECRLRDVRIRPGRTMTVSLSAGRDGVVMDGVDAAIVFDVLGTDGTARLSTANDQGTVVYDQEWRQLPADAHP